MPFVPGFEEDGFLKSLRVNMSMLEPLAKKCTQVNNNSSSCLSFTHVISFQVLVWHTKTYQPYPKRKIDKTVSLYPDSNLKDLMRYIDMIDPAHSTKPSSQESSKSMTVV